MYSTCFEIDGIATTKVKVLLVPTIGCLSEHWTRLVFAKERQRDSGHIVKIRTRGAVNFCISSFESTD